MRKLTVSEMNRVSGGDGAVHVASIGAQANRGSIMAGGFVGAISGAASGALNGMGGATAAGGTAGCGLAIGGLFGAGVGALGFGNGAASAVGALAGAAVCGRIAAASAAIPARPEVQAAVDPAARAVAEALLETPGDRAPPRFAGSGHGLRLLGDMFAERRKDRRLAPYADRRLASRRQ